MNVFKKIWNGIKKAAHWVAEINPDDDICGITLSANRIPDSLTFVEEG